MRVLLDENIDRRIRGCFEPVHEVVTVPQRGWGGKKNGELLGLAAAEFDVFVTMDRSLRHQQNLAACPLRIVLIVTKSNRRQDIQPAMAAVNQAIREMRSGELRVVTA